MPVRVAIIGHGHGGSVFHAPLVSATPGMEVAAIVTSHPQRQANARRDYPSARLLNSPEDLWSGSTAVDLVVITTPNQTHAPLGAAAMRAGLPVVIDKPVAVTAAEARELIAISRETRQPFTVFHNARWANSFLTVRQLIASDTLGPITRYEARSERYRPAPRPGAWRENGAPEVAGGLLYDLGSHLIDQALVLFGRPSRVYAELGRRRPGTQVDDDTFVALEFAGGVRAHLWMSYVARMPGPVVRITGLRGAYEKRAVDPQEDSLRTGLRPGDPGWGVEPPDRWGTLSTDIGGLPFHGQVETSRGRSEEFYSLMRDALTAGGQVPVDPADALTTMEVIEAAQQSARTGMVVAM